MVFENLTLFELHLENSRFGPSFGGDESGDVDEQWDEGETAQDSSGGGLGRAIGAIVLFAVVAMAVRWYRSGEDGMGSDEDTDQITIEHATEQ